MANLNDRLKAFESKYAMDEGMHFKIAARRNKLLGIWVGEQLGKSGADLDAYAKDVVVSDLKEAGDEDVIAKVMADMSAAGLEMSPDDIRAKLSACDTAAKEQLAVED